MRVTASGSCRASRPSGRHRRNHRCRADGRFRGQRARTARGGFGQRAGAVGDRARLVRTGGDRTTCRDRESHRAWHRSRRSRRSAAGPSVACSLRFSCRTDPATARDRMLESPRRAERTQRARTRLQGPRRLPAGVGDRQPAARHPARRRHPHAGQRQRRRHQCAAHPGLGFRARRDRRRRGQGFACRRLVARSRPARRRHRSGRGPCNGWRSFARRPWCSATSIPCGTSFAVARARQR